MLADVFERSDSVLSSAQRPRARAAAGYVADKLTDPIVPRRTFELAQRQSPFLGEFAYDARSLSAGNAGVATMLGAFAACEERRHAAADAHLRAAVANEPLGAGPSLFGGVPGLLAAARTASRGVHYSMLIRQIQSHVDGFSVTVADRLRRGVVRDVDYDLITGASGLLAVTVDPAAREGLSRALATLAVIPAGRGWRARSRFGEKEAVGNNLGLAHGAAGLIASLARCREVEGVEDGVAALVCFILANCLRRGKLVTGVPHFIGDNGSISSRRAAWCYGGPGVAIALLSADEAFDMPEARAAAKGMLEHVASQSDSELGLLDDGLCHGRAGVALALAAGALALESSALLMRSREMFDVVIANLEPEFAVGYRSAGPDGTQYDDASLLTGSAGIALALLVASGAVDPGCLLPFQLDRVGFAPA